MWLQVINKVKFIHQGEGHIKFKVKYLSLQILCSPYSLQAGGLHLIECVLVVSENYQQNQDQYRKKSPMLKYIVYEGFLTSV